MDIICLDRRKTAYIGILGAVLFTIMWLASIYADGNWIFGVETLSDLGHPSRAGHPLFNAAAVIAGILLGIFALGMYYTHQTFLYARTSMAIAMAACVSLVGVGIFPIHVEVYHTVASFVFFGLMIVGLSVWTVHDWTRGGNARPYAYFTALLLVISLSFLAFTELGLAEAVAVMMIMLWAVVQCHRMLRDQ